MRINSHIFDNALSRLLKNYCRSFYAKLAFFIVFVLKLQTDFAARLCFWFSAMTLPLNKFARPCFRVFKKRTSFPLTEMEAAARELMGMAATLAASERAFSHAVELHSAKCANFGVRIFAILMLMRMNPHLVMN